MRNAEVIRQWKILKDIETSRTGVTIHDLSERVGVSTRTIRRDLQALQEVGFALFDEGEENETKRWKLDAQPFKLVQEGLAIQDVAALYLSRSIVEAFSAWPLADELRTALAKIENALNPRTREFLSALPQVIETKAAPKTGGRDLIDVTRRLFDATRTRRVCQMRYFSAASGKAKQYEVHPHRLALAHGGLYLVAWVRQYDEFRTFAVDRIERLSVQEHTFKPAKELPTDLFSASLGVFSAEPERIEVEFTAQAAPYVRGRVWHDSQQTDTLADGRLRVSLDVSNDWALRSWLLSFGADVKVLSPAGLAASIRDAHRGAAGRY